MVYIYICVCVMFKDPVTPPSYDSPRCLATVPAAEGLVDAPTATFAGCRAADTKFLAVMRRKKVLGGSSKLVSGL